MPAARLIAIKDTLVSAAAFAVGLSVCYLGGGLWSVYGEEDGLVGYLEYRNDRSHCRWSGQRVDAENHHTTIPACDNIRSWLPAAVWGREMFLTGSRVYGTPKPDSDWDVVLLAEEPADATKPTDLDVLIAAADPVKSLGPRVDDYDNVRSAGSFRFGPVNVIVCTTPWQYQTWRRGTDRLIAEAPVTRDRAIEVFQETFRQPAATGC